MAPSAGRWIPVTLNTAVTPRKRGTELAVRLVLSDGSERIVDHVMAATGFRIDIAKYPFLPSPAERVARAGLPSSRRRIREPGPGLHFLGAAAARSYGPLMRFVSGTWFTTRTLVKEVGR